MERYEVLRSIGLSKLAIRSYYILYSSGPSILSKLASRLDCRVNSLYPVMNELLDKGFVLRFDLVGPGLYLAIPVRTALRKIWVDSQLKCRELIAAQEMKS